MMHMARGPSGRVVIEVDPELKRELHAALVADGDTLKDWFIGRARQFLAERNQPDLPGIATYSRDGTRPSRKVADRDPEADETGRNPGRNPSSSETDHE